MPVNSRQKGKRREREACVFLRGLGFDARRTEQYAGNDGTADVVSECLSNVHIEVKGGEKIWPGSTGLDGAIEQARRDCLGRPWAVLHRRNRGQWMLTCAMAAPPLIATVWESERIKHALLALNDRTGHVGTGLYPPSDTAEQHQREVS